MCVSFSCPLPHHPHLLTELSKVYTFKRSSYCCTLRFHAHKYEKSGLFFKEETEKRLLNYNWPGNIRELQHSIEKAVIICDETALKPEDFFFKATDSAPATGSANQTLQDMEKDMIEKAIKQHGGNISAIAAQLGITRQTLYNKMKKFGL